MGFQGIHRFTGSAFLLMRISVQTKSFLIGVRVQKYLRMVLSIA